MIIRGRAMSKLWVPSPISRSTFDFALKKSPQSEGTFLMQEIRVGSIKGFCKFVCNLLPC